MSKNNLRFASRILQDINQVATQIGINMILLCLRVDLDDLLTFLGSLWRYPHQGKITNQLIKLRILANIKTYDEGLRRLVTPFQYHSQTRRGPAYLHLERLLVGAGLCLHRGRYGRPTYPPGKKGSSRLEGALCWLMGRRGVLSSVVGLLWMVAGP